MVVIVVIVMVMVLVYVYVYVFIYVYVYVYVCRKGMRKERVRALLKIVSRMLRPLEFTVKIDNRITLDRITSSELHR